MGAGLLSSIGESAWCMTDKVKKIPLFPLKPHILPFDITPATAPNFLLPQTLPTLNRYLEEFCQ